MVLRSPLRGLFTRLAELAVADLRARGVKRLTHIPTSTGCNLKPHARKSGIGLHPNPEAEVFARLMGGLHIPVLSRQEEQP